MPSMFEPCGLSQMISLRYGTLPIARETGGLRDTVLSYNEFTGDGNGFTFLNYNAHDMLHVIEGAVKMYHENRIDLRLGWPRAPWRVSTAGISSARRLSISRSIRTIIAKRRISTVSDARIKSCT